MSTTELIMQKKGWRYGFIVTACADLILFGAGIGVFLGLLDNIYDELSKQDYDAPFWICIAILILTISVLVGGLGGAFLLLVAAKEDVDERNVVEYSMDWIGFNIAVFPIAAIHVGSFIDAGIFFIGFTIVFRGIQIFIVYKFALSLIEEFKQTTESTVVPTVDVV